MDIIRGAIKRPAYILDKERRITILEYFLFFPYNHLSAARLELFLTVNLSDKPLGRISLQKSCPTKDLMFYFINLAKEALNASQAWVGSWPLVTTGTIATSPNSV